VFGLDFVAPLADCGAEDISQLLIAMNVELDFGKEGCKFVLFLLGDWHAFCDVDQVFIFSGLLILRVVLLLWFGFVL
jgi:hypothetical protein